MAGKTIGRHADLEHTSLATWVMESVVLAILIMGALLVARQVAIGCDACPCIPAPNAPKPCPCPLCPPFRTPYSSSEAGIDLGATRPSATSGPIYLRYGAVIQEAVDLEVSGPSFPWQQVRSYYSGGSGRTALGGKWFSGNNDVRISEGIIGEQRILFNAFSKRVFENQEGYAAPNDSSYKLVDEGVDEFLLTDTVRGDVYDFSPRVSAHNTLEERTTLAWQHASRDGIIYTYDGNNVLTQVTTAEGQDYNVVFSYTGDLLTKIEVRTGADTSTRIQEVVYTYFDSQTHSADLGTDDDLVQVKVGRLKTGGSPSNTADWIVRYTQYRYDADGPLKAVFESDAVQRLIDDRSDISDADDILGKGDDDDNSGSEEHQIKEYASRRFLYYTVDLKTDNSGAGTSGDPKCVTVWNAQGENLQSKYGGTNAVEYHVDNHIQLVKKEIAGGCAGCGSSDGGVSREYFYLDIGQGVADENEVVRLVVEDTIDANGNGLFRTVYGLNDAGRMLRQVRITDPAGSPNFWCESWKMVVADGGAQTQRWAEYRTPAAHNVSSSTVDEFLNPSANGSFTNDTNTLNDSAGLIHVYEYTSDGFPAAQRVKRGRTGNAYYVRATDYTGGATKTAST